MGCSTFLRVKSLADGIKYNVTCIISTEFLSTQSDLQYWSYEAGLDLLFCHLSLGYNRNSKNEFPAWHADNFGRWDLIC